MIVSYVIIYYVECRPGYFGPDCIRKCGQCFRGSECDNANGICSKGCSDGYKGAYCKEGLYFVYKIPGKKFAIFCFILKYNSVRKK